MKLMWMINNGRFQLLAMLVALLGANHGVAQEFLVSQDPTMVLENGIIQERETACCSNSGGLVSRMMGMGWCELEQMYRCAKVPTLPCGYCRGKVLIHRQGLFSEIETKVARMLWRGKHINCCTNISINQWPLRKAIKAKIYYGPGLFDGQPALIVDYTQTSFRWRNVKDEIREVAPGVYLGAYFVRKRGCWKQKLFFMMQASRGRTCCGE